MAFAVDSVTVICLNFRLSLSGLFLSPPSVERNNPEREWLSPQYFLQEILGGEPHFTPNKSPSKMEILLGVASAKSRLQELFRVLVSVASRPASQHSTRNPKGFRLPQPSDRRSDAPSAKH